MRSWKSSETAPAAAPGDVSAQAAKEPEYLEIAQIQAPYGTDGEVRARIITDFPGRFARLKSVHVGPAATAYPLERSRVQGGEVFLKLGGVDTPEAAAKLRFATVQVPDSAAVKLPRGAYFHHQIIGLQVVTADGTALGRVTEILPTGANDVYVVQGEAGEYLIPAVASVVRQVDLPGGRLVVELLAGMEPTPPREPKPPRTARKTKEAPTQAAPVAVPPPDQG